jgi:hypothetical protein
VLDTDEILKSGSTVPRPLMDVSQATVLPPCRARDRIIDIALMDCGVSRDRMYSKVSRIIFSSSNIFSFPNGSTSAAFCRVILQFKVGG